MAAGDYIFKLGNLTSLGMDGLGNDVTTPQGRPGTINFCVDAFGPRILQYCKFMNQMVIGELASQPALASAGTITAGTTTSATSSSLTADAHDGKIFYVLDNADAAGAAPEGEMSIVRNNTTTVIALEPNLPLSAAIANADTASLVSVCHAEDSADGDERRDVLGVVVSAEVSANNYGWIHRQGKTKAIFKGSSALVIGDPVVADAALIGPFGSDVAELWIGTGLVTVTNDQVTPRALVHIDCFVGGPVDYNP